MQGNARRCRAVGGQVKRQCSQAYISMCRAIRKFAQDLETQLNK